MQKFLVPKALFKSKTFLFLMGAVILLTVLAMLSAYDAFKMPEIVTVGIGVLLSVLIGGEKIKDAVETSATVLAEGKVNDLKLIGRAIVNNDAAKWVGAVGVFLNSILAVLSQQEGVVIDPVIIGTMNTIIGTFIGFDTYKNQRILTAAELKKTGGK